MENKQPLIGNMNRKKAAAIVVAVVVVSSVALVAWWYPTTQPDVRIGYLTQDLHQLALRVAIVNGWFAEAGLSVELLSYQNGAYEMDGFQSGQIDMGYLGIAPALVKTINQGIGVTVLAGVNSEGSSIEVLKSEFDSGRITSIADLAGKTIYEPGPSTVQNFLLRLALNQSGMTVDDVQLSVARVQDMADSLSADSPSFIAWEPFPSLAEYENITVPLLSSHDIWPNHPCCVLASTNDFLSNNAAVVQKVVAIHVRAEEWILNHPSEALAIAVDWLGAAQAPVESALGRIIYNYTINVSGIQTYLQFLVSQGLAQMDTSQIGPFLSTFLNESYIQTS
jgi:NitT/TauT family transport system substrate-binding protein